MKTYKYFIVLLVLSALIFFSCNTAGDKFIKPVDGTVFIPFGISKDPLTGINKEFGGITYAADTQQPVEATLDGTVIDKGEKPANFGIYLVLEHKNGFKSLYANLGSVSVSKDDSVKRGEVIGSTGNTGRSYRENSVFFAIYLNDKAVNPVDYF